MIKRIVGIVTGLLLLAGCSHEENVFEQQGNAEGVKTFTSFTAILDDVAGTRAYLSGSSSGGKRRVFWEEGDEISVYSDTDTTLKTFRLTSLSENNVATFEGDGVTGNIFYAVYAPYIKHSVNQLHSYIVHFSPSSDLTESSGSDSLFKGPMVATSTDGAFVFKQIMGIIQIELGNINEINLYTFHGNNDEVLYGYSTVDLSEDQPVMKLLPDASITTLGMTRTGNSNLSVYISIPPMVLEKGFCFEVEGKDKDGKAFKIEKKYNSKLEVKAGTLFHFSMIDISAELEADDTNYIITFADPTVKQICVENWDTNGNGELSFIEAAAVTGLGSAFKSNTTIESFNELQYFTGIEFINPEAFSGCTNLSQITLPESIRAIGYSAFKECHNLLKFKLPENLTAIGANAFANCFNLRQINLPEKLTTIGSNAFQACADLTQIVLPNSLTSIGEEAFKGCYSLVQITSLSANPPALGVDAFNTQNQCPIYVPALAMDDYKEAEGWNNYIDRIVAISGLVVERKYLVHWASNNSTPHFGINFNNNNMLMLSYNNHSWADEFGIYLYAGPKNGDDDRYKTWRMGDRYKTWIIRDAIADEWIDEKIVIYADGTIEYYHNGSYEGSTIIPELDLGNASSFHIDANPYGWYTGHYHYMDDLVISGAASFAEDFNDGLSSDKWKTPVNPDGVYTEDGILKMYQLRTDQPFNLLSKEIPVYFYQSGSPDHDQDDKPSGSTGKPFSIEGYQW